MTATKEEIETRLARARLVALDVDGTLTDGRVVYLDGADGAVGELQAFDVTDGVGISLLRRAGVLVAWITGRGCAATRRRAEDLGVRELHVRSGPKDRVLAAVQEAHGIAVEETVAMGDDLPDLAMARRAALFCAPAGARPEVLRVADLVTGARGGRGAVRELAERMLVARGEWTAQVAHFERGAASDDAGPRGGGGR